MGKRLVPNNIKNFRLLRGMSQRKLAEALNRSSNTIANWEKGINQPDVDTLEDICDVLNITPNQIYGWDQSPELDSFLAEQKETIETLEILMQNKSDLDARIRIYADKLSQIYKQNKKDKED